MATCRSSFVLFFVFLLNLWIFIKAGKELCGLAWMLSSTVKLYLFLSFSILHLFFFLLFFTFFFTACKSLLNKKSDSAKVRLSRRLSALFCSTTLCPVSPLLAQPSLPFYTFCSFSVPLSGSHPLPSIILRALFLIQ